KTPAKKQEVARNRTKSVSSHDPNEFVGPAGYGDAGFLTIDQTLPYTIAFENQSNATAPAQVVVITQQLGTNLDWHTFELGDLGFGGTVVHVPTGLHSYETRVDDRAVSGLFVDVTADINILTGLVTWTFTSIDPTTLEPTTDPLAGFLPPDQ